MAKPQLYTIYILLLAITLGCANSARILDEVDPQSPFPANPTQSSSDPAETDVSDVAPVVPPVVGPDTTLPSGEIPAATIPVADVAPIAGPSIPLPTGPAPVTTPSGTVAPVANVAPIAPLPTGPVPVTTSGTVAPIATPAVTSPGGTGSIASASATVDPQHPLLTFFMHDILGGSHPSGRVVTGIIANSQANGLPFSKPNGQIFPINGGVPLNNINGLINNNNVPFLVGLNGSPTSSVNVQNGDNNVVNGGNNLPFVTAGQLPSGVTLQQLMFGSITVVDNELTEGHELGSAVLGKGQGFYLSSSLDGSSHTIVLTTLFHSGDHEGVEDTISFFGVHRTASQESQIAVVGGTGKYEHAKGYATVETLHQEDQHTTDGVETILHFIVYLTTPLP